MSVFTLKLEALGGANLPETIREAKQKAIDLDLAYVKFNFNGCTFSIGQNADVKKVMSLYPQENYIVSA